MAIFKGAGTAIITPFQTDGSVDYKEFERLIEFQITGGADAIIVCGTTGESSTLTHEEHLDVIKYCIEVVGGRIPVVAGTGSNCTATAVYLSTEAQKLGADGLLVVTPYYNKGTQQGLYEHYKIIAESVKLPIIVYNVPSRTGTNVAPETAARMCREIENVVGVKDAANNIVQTAKMMSLAEGKLDLYSGNDDQITPMMSLGGIGVISVLSNVLPRETHEICERFFEGDVAGSCKLQLKVLPLVEALFCEVNPIPVKKAMSLMGYGEGTLRRPLTQMEDKNVVRLKAAMKEWGLV
ncbi:MAG: 4-hydroxy-tetrahydrodipicolinate synthase [Lachnospiraceae bacterium]|nr:4-hydroxy-tetrahydrodipicolinate synthase [Lachnospiraceae bacterium]